MSDGIQIPPEEKDWTIVIVAVVVVVVIVVIIALSCVIHKKKSKDAVNLRDRQIEVQKIDDRQFYNQNMDLIQQNKVRLPFQKSVECMEFDQQIEPKQIKLRPISQAKEGKMLQPLIADGIQEK